VEETDAMTEIIEKEDKGLQEMTNVSIVENEDTGRTSAENLTIRLTLNVQASASDVENKATSKKIVL